MNEVMGYETDLLLRAMQARWEQERLAQECWIIDWGDDKTLLPVKCLSRDDADVIIGRMQSVGLKPAIIFHVKRKSKVRNTVPLRVYVNHARRS